MHAHLESKDLEIDVLKGSKQSLESDLTNLQTTYTQLQVQSQEWHQELISVQEKLLEEYQSKSLLDQAHDQLLAEKSQLTQEISDFEEMMVEMKAVAEESELKDATIRDLGLQLEQSEENAFAFEAHVYKLQQDRQDTFLEIEMLQGNLQSALGRIEEFENIKVCSFCQVLTLA